MVAPSKPNVYMYNSIVDCTHSWIQLLLYAILQTILNSLSIKPLLANILEVSRVLA